MSSARLPGEEPMTPGTILSGSRLLSRERLFERARQIEFSSELPREDSGKIFKRRLRDAYWTDRERRI